MSPLYTSFLPPWWKYIFHSCAGKRAKRAVSFRLNPQWHINNLGKEHIKRNAFIVCVGGGGVENSRQWEKFHGINYKLIRSSFLQEAVSFNWGENNDHNSRQLLIRKTAQILSGLRDACETHTHRLFSRTQTHTSGNKQFLFFSACMCVLVFFLFPGIHTRVGAPHSETEEPV